MDTAKILFVVDKYFPKPYANALCAQALMEEFCTRGYEVHTLAFQDSGIPLPEQKNGVQVFGVKPDLRLRLYYYSANFPQSKWSKPAKLAAHLLSKSKRLLMLPWTPLYSYSFAKRICHRITDLHRAHSYSAVIALMGPFEGCHGAMLFKKKYPSVPFAIYAVDTMRKPAIAERFGETFGSGLFWEKRLIQVADTYYYMQSRSADYARPEYVAYQRKLIPTDLPRLKVLDLRETQNYIFAPEGAEHWVYAGSVGGRHYNADAMIRWFLQLAGNKKRVLHLYSRGLTTALKEQIVQSNGKICWHDYVNADTLKSIMKSADVLVTLKTSDQISAKIFECISYRKPIIHFSGHRDDPNRKYLAHYPLGYIVDTTKPMEVADIQKLESFLSGCRGKTVDAEELKERFKMSTPEYSVDVIMEGLGLSLK